MPPKSRSKPAASATRTAPAPAPAPAPAAAPPSAFSASAEPTRAAESAPVPAAPKPESDDILLQDWTPLGQCLDHRIGQAVWRHRAAPLFADNKVPNLVHDSGAQSQRGARLLQAWCRERADRGDLPARIVLCEAGMGTGLHLRYFLDAFRERAQVAGTDWYERLQVFATDVAPDTIRQAFDRGLFAPHAGRVELGYMDVLQPGLFRSAHSGRSVDLRGHVHLMLANYVLDTLPMDIFRRQRGPRPGAGNGDPGAWWEGVLVRTWLRRADLLGGYTDRALDDVRKAARDEDDPSLDLLADVWTLVQLELRAWPVDLSGNPDLGELERVADAQEAALGADHALLRDGTVVNHSAAALRALVRLAATLAEGGMVLVRDVATVTPEAAAHPRAYQNYGPTSAAGVNLVQADGWFGAGQAPHGATLHKPHHDGARNQATRLLVRGELPRTVAEFETAFDGVEVARAADLADQAREATKPADAMELYRQAVLLEPTNWHLLAEAARSALAEARRPDLAAAIAHRGLQLNERYSPELWNVYGDAQFALGDFNAARQAYAHGLQVHPTHARLHYCMAVAEANRGRFDAAFRHAGEALATDRTGAYRSDTLQVLDACLRGSQRKVELEDERLKTRSDR
ncbi:MAG: tetratricopeptide repeat protein [Myxococcales bacterium]|nr:tetratricopeptide repeat protein [Myxococcales bacterium]